MQKHESLQGLPFLERLRGEINIDTLMQATYRRVCFEPTISYEKNNVFIGVYVNNKDIDNGIELIYSLKNSL